MGIACNRRVIDRTRSRLRRGTHRPGLSGCSCVLLSIVGLAGASSIPHLGSVPDSNSILAGITVATAVVGLFTLLVRRVTAAIRAGRALASEIGLFKKI